VLDGDVGYLRSATGRRAVLGIEHIGSAHDGAQLAVLLQDARKRLHVAQGLLPLETPSGGGPPLGRAVVDGTASLIVCEALRGVFDALGFAPSVTKHSCRRCLGQIIEPTSKADTVRVLTDLAVPAPTRVTFMRYLKRVVERDYLHVVADACFAHATRDGALALLLDDGRRTTLYSRPNRRRLRKVGMSKERRVDPPGHRGAADRPGRVPAAGAPVRRQQGRDQDADPATGSRRSRRVPRRPSRRRRTTTRWMDHDVRFIQEGPSE